MLNEADLVNLQLRTLYLEEFAQNVPTLKRTAVDPAPEVSQF